LHNVAIHSTNLRVVSVRLVNIRDFFVEVQMPGTGSPARLMTAWTSVGRSAEDISLTSPGKVLGGKQLPDRTSTKHSLPL
jgi:hypothetical protein